jgi:hypothetical protein
MPDCLAVGRVMGANHALDRKRKPPFGGFLRFEDAKVGLLVAFFCLLSDTHPFEHVSLFKLESVLVSGYLA